MYIYTYTAVCAWGVHVRLVTMVINYRRAWIRMCMCTHEYVLVWVCIHAYTHTRRHTLTTDTQIRSYVLVYVYAYAYAHTHTHTHITSSHKCIHACTRTCTSPSKGVCLIHHICVMLREKRDETPAQRHKSAAVGLSFLTILLVLFVDVLQPGAGRGGVRGGLPRHGVSIGLICGNVRRITWRENF